MTLTEQKFRYNCKGSLQLDMLQLSFILKKQPGGKKTKQKLLELVFLRLVETGCVGF